MIRIKFNEEETEALRFERYHNASARVQQKMEALYLKSKGLPHSEICRICEISKTTLITYLREYQKGGIEMLKSETKYKGRLKEVKPTRMGYKHISEEVFA
ncbi:helix-turn-helix domain containing protein [Porifericola rhodea]|uniref:helix-turn-helix domain-containing protein n=1 Tax=Porifericola rhodea TaxID=930972 RepID=UPI002665205E|nr:helix-turn-helix domain-containing protein [Porifericola rhodea]WKN31829.1 helix-turn-helix domain containing protein [Porifericola rhodea]